jgi:hypothetical protein
VLIVCPWQPNLPLPDAEGPSAGDAAAPTRLGEWLRRETVKRYHRAFREVRRTFGRMGVTVLCAPAGDPVRLILERLDRLRLAGRRR